MKRMAEVVLNGHPDKFCDLIADRLIWELYRANPNMVGAIEASIWWDAIFLSGSVVSEKDLSLSCSSIIHQLGQEIGYGPGNPIDVTRHRILDHISWFKDDPEKYSDQIGDQSIVIGYAGYDGLTRYLPPEHFLAWYFREKIMIAMKEGPLQGQGPDGKILVSMAEDALGWHLNLLLITLQQHPSMKYLHFITLVHKVLRDAYRQLQQVDPRWCVPWEEIDLLINPKGPFLLGGSDGDNGQTGRKLVMDFYGPRIPIGGGALYGKHLLHIDRIGAMMARKFALHMVRNGSKEALVSVCFAPGIREPLCIEVFSDKRPGQKAKEFFHFNRMKCHVRLEEMNYDLVGLWSFYNSRLSFNEVG